MEVKSFIGIPVYGEDSKIIAAAMAINKKNEFPFTNSDFEEFQKLLVFLAIFIQKCKMLRFQ